ncbi:MAG: hypothetical protein JXQ87_05110 [Bacteroidia bacterium]
MKLTRKITILAIILGIVWTFNRCSAPEKIASAISPPFAGFNVPTQNLTINGKNGGVIELENGTKISIPENCFIDENGNLYNETVELDYREFHSVADVIASGIPMEFTENGEAGNLATAGMIELQGKGIDGTTVKIAGNKEITFELASYNDPDNVEFFDLNEETGVWTKTGTPGKKPVESESKYTDSLRKLEQLKAPFEPKKSDENTPVVRFRVSDNTGALANMETVVWQYAGEDSENDPFKNAAFNEGDYKITETKVIDKQLKTLQVTIQFEGEILKGEEESAKTADTMVTYFQPVLSNAQFVEAMEVFTDKESQFNLLMEKKQKLKDMMALEAKVIRSFSIKNFGFFNCDVFLRRPAYQLQYEFTQNGNQFTDAASVYLVNETNGTSNVVKSGYSANNIKNIRLFTNGNSRIVVVLPGDKVKVIENSEIQNILSKKAKFYSFSIDDAVAVNNMSELNELF